MGSDPEDPGKLRLLGGVCGERAFPFLGFADVAWGATAPPGALLRCCALLWEWCRPERMPAPSLESPALSRLRPDLLRCTACWARGAASFEYCAAFGSGADDASR